MRRIGIIGISAGFFLVLASGQRVATDAHVEDGPWPARTDRLTIIVPAYFYPSGQALADWARLVEAAQAVPLEVILNPASGPGRTRDRKYVAVIEPLRRSGARILAYVDSDYGRRPLETVAKDLWAYRAFYKIDGYFIDQMANTPEAIAYYRALRDLVRRIDPRLAVVGNPGTTTRPEYLEAADRLVTFEGPARTFAGYDPDVMSPWTAEHAPGRFAAIVYGVGTATAGRETLARARQAGSGSVYVTDQTLPNPYLGLPPYWADLVAAVRAMNEPPTGAGT